MNKDALIYVAGHRGLVGSAIVRRLETEGYRNLLLRSSSELDLRDQLATRAFLSEHKPEFVFLAAAKVGGILANSRYPVDFLLDNLAIQCNVITSSFDSGVSKLLFLGSSCIYPKECPQPIREEYLLTGPLEKSNEWYAVAKIAGIRSCQAYNLQLGTNFICAMPTNLYGPHDNFDLESSHVLAAMIRKFHEGRIEGSPVTLWGSGSPRREFLHVDDLADACLFLMESYSGTEPINIGTGEDLTIRELASLVAEVVGSQGSVRWDSSKPDGTPRKLLDVSRLTSLGWRAKIPLARGIEDTYSWFRSAYAGIS